MLFQSKLISRVDVEEKTLAYRKFIYKGFKRCGPLADYSILHLIAVGDVSTGELITKDHTEVSKFGAFDNANGLVIGNDEAHEIPQEIRRGVCWDVLASILLAVVLAGRGGFVLEGIAPPILRVGFYVLVLMMLL
jgi:hypothetical protein